MGGKKKEAAKSAAKDGDEVDESTKKVYAAYLKNCKAMEFKAHETIKKMYEEDYVNDDKDFTKVSLARSSNSVVDSHLE